ncbi:MAG: T9SS type A sorting domain-containing protein [Brumimicrobium sp.]|nr:T9SS type A sorting domain-containing protein [Brumimicrobium sp.]
MKVMFNLRYFCLSVMALGFSFFSFSQNSFEYNKDINVKVNGNTLKHPWAGGLNHPQFSTLDVNFDGLQDLFIFDRSTNQILVFLTEDNNGVKSYKYLHNAASLFPNDVKYRAAFYDYDNDGKNDLFTYGTGGIKVYKNIGNSVDGLQWELVKNIVQSKYDNGNITNLYVSIVDIPAYYDVDGDGDMDVLTYHIGGQHLEYHKNVSVEKYGIPDSLEFEMVNACWGKFYESDSDNAIELNSNQGPCGDFNAPEINAPTRHSGVSILALNLNNDNATDLIIGNVESYNVTALINGNTDPTHVFTKMTSQDANYPNYDTPVNISTFPSLFYVDVDFDGKKDLLVSTNQNGNSENKKSVWFYKNIGSNQVPDFSFQQIDFLQDEMIENGKGSIPILVDLDNDGLLDLLVSNNYEYIDLGDRTTKIQYYKNTGTSTTPEYTLLNEDWLDFSTSGYGLRLIPTFGDLNGDGNNEMILGGEDGKLRLLTRSNFDPNGYAFSTLLKDNLGNDIVVDASAAPQLFDMDKDGLLDLVIGKRTPGLVYYKNIGTSSAYSFQLVTPNLGNVDMGTAFLPHHYAIPHFYRQNDTTFLLAGNRVGSIYLYKDIDGNLENGNPFSIVTNHYADINVGSFSAPFIGKLNNSDKLTLMVGTDLGGLWCYTADNLNTSTAQIPSQQTIDNNLLIYPNPSSNGQFIIDMENMDYPLDIVVYNTIGKEVKQLTQCYGTITLNIENEEKGLYYILFKQNNTVIATRKLISR